MPPKKRNLTVVPQVQTAPVLKNHFFLIIDKSGSMGGIAPYAIKAFNQNLDSIREGARQAGQESTVTMLAFSYGIEEYCRFTPADKVEQLTSGRYRVSGGTALFDAVGHALQLCRNHPDANNPNASFVLLVVTDGEENSSRSYNATRLRNELAEAMKTDRYTTAFLLPKGAGQWFAKQFDIPLGNVREWEQTEKGVEKVAQLQTNAMSTYYTARASGQTMSKSLYTTDLSSLQKSDLTKFDDVSGNFRSISVDKEEEIQPFFERHGKKFVLGAGYYQLTKKEKLRDGRNILIQEKGGKKVFGGAQARQILGVPTGEVTVTPGNHANYDVYFQSTSRNRKLVRGTKLLIDVTKAKDDTETWDSAAAKAAADLKKAKLESAAQQTIVGKTLY